MWLIGYQIRIVNDFWAFMSIFEQWIENESLSWLCLGNLGDVGYLGLRITDYGLRITDSKMSRLKRGCLISLNAKRACYAFAGVSACIDYG